MKFMVQTGSGAWVILEAMNLARARSIATGIAAAFGAAAVLLFGLLRLFLLVAIWRADGFQKMLEQAQSDAWRLLALGSVALLIAFPLYLVPRLLRRSKLRSRGSLKPAARPTPSVGQPR
jgi:hypothetical protein